MKVWFSELRDALKNFRRNIKERVVVGEVGSKRLIIKQQVRI